MSIFLMGCYDPESQKWCTVTKCSGGHDDATLARLQKELDMVKISKVRKSSLPRHRLYFEDLGLQVSFLNSERSLLLSHRSRIRLLDLRGPALWTMGHCLPGEGESLGDHKN